MTLTFLGKRALEDGPLTMREFSEALGIGLPSASSTLNSLMKSGIVERCTTPGMSRYLYRLAA